MAELRPHIQPKEFLPMVKRLAEIADFQLAYLTDGEIKSRRRVQNLRMARRRQVS
jgi:hypothetical protein